MNEISSQARTAERLYYDSADLIFRAQVTDIQLVAKDHEQGQLWRLALDRTAFYPESGGQPWDTGVLVATARSGTVLEVPVERVEEDEAGEVWHFVRKPLLEGAEVEGRIDAVRRTDHMQQHSGQHLLSAVFLERLGARTTSFHLGVDTSTIDLALPEGLQSLTSTQVAEVEAAANRLIFEDRAMPPTWRSRAEADAMLARGELRKLPERTGPMRIVAIEGVELNACGGTHVRSTGAIGGLLCRRIEKVKQGWRLEFVCGLRAVRAARRDYEILTTVANGLSVASADVPSRLALLQGDLRSAEKGQRALLDEFAEAKAAQLVAAAKGNSIVQAKFADKSVDFCKRVASGVVAGRQIALLGATEEQKAAFVLGLPAGDTRHAGNLLREVTALHGLRGGGGPQLAQGVCEPTQLESVLQALYQKLSRSAGD